MTRLLPEFTAAGSRCWAAEAAPTDLGVFVSPGGPLVAAAAAKAAGARLLMTATFYDPKSGALCGLLRGGGKQWGWQPPGRPALAVIGGRAAVLPVAVNPPGADLVVGGGPVLLAGGNVVWRESHAQGKFAGLRPDARLARAAVGVRADGMVVALVAAGLSLQALAEVLRDKSGCADAMALDGGGSATMTWNGKVLFGGARALPCYLTAGPLLADPAAAAPSALNHFQIAPHFSLHELEDPTTHEVMVHLLLIMRLEAARALDGGPLDVTSGYRTPDHNAAVGGAPDSRHLRGEAADIRSRRHGPAALAALCERAGFMGIGVYPAHVHADVRETPARWTGGQC